MLVDNSKLVGELTREKYVTHKKIKVCNVIIIGKFEALIREANKMW